MRFLRKLRLQAAWLLRRVKAEADLTDELQDYIERQTERHLASGLSPEKARLAALREVSGVEALKEACRDVRSFRHVDTLLQDFNYGLRQLRKNPGFTATAVLTLAFGIGVNTTIFSLVSSMLLRKPPIHDPDRVMMLLSQKPGAGSPADEANRMPVSAADFLDWRAQATSFSGIAASFLQDFTLSGDTRPERVPGAQVSANYFKVLGVTPVLGRTFVPGEDQVGRDRAILLREDLWKGHFAANPQVIGHTVRINGERYTVIGIMPGSFRRSWLFPAQMWVPLVFRSEQLQPASRNAGFLHVFARLKPGVSGSEAKAELATIAQRIAAVHPETEKGWTANLMTVQKYAIEESNSKTALEFLQAAVAFVLLIACANVISLLLARNSARQREFAIRTALGAGRYRLARQLLTECLILALLGGSLGLLLTFWGLRMLRAGFNWNEYAVHTAESLSIDSTVLVFTFSASVAAALIFGLAPALQLSQRGVSAGLKESSRTTTAGRQHHRLQKLLVIGELVLSMILLTGAGLFVGYFIQEMRADPGLNPHNVLTASVRLSGPGYKTPAQQAAFFQNVIRRIAVSPEVVSAAVTSDLPFTFAGAARVAIEGRPAPKTEKQAMVGYFGVSPGYFSAAQIPLREGREFTLFDKAGSLPVVIVNQAFAAKFFPQENPLGRHIRISHEDSLTSATGPSWSEIVGVVGNVNEFLGQVRPRPQIFEPFLQQPVPSMNLLVRLRTDPGAFAALLRQAVWLVDKDQAVTNLRTMDRVMQAAGQGDDLMAELMGGFACVALLMAAFGIYGLIAYLVARRRQEIGVRMAVGATQHEVLTLVLRNSMSLAVTGVVVGFIFSLALPRLVMALFTDFHVRSGWIVCGTPLVVILVGLAASYFPARRAAKVDPMVALRNE